jgi:acetyl-CoA carboxylase biotin carboxyl carrier protein
VDWEKTLERVREAAEFCASSGLARFRVEDDDLAIEVRRTPRPAAPTPGLPEAAPAVNGHSGNGLSNGTEARPQTVLKAEFVGIVRLSRPSVSEGTVLNGARELAYVESLGIRNPVRAKGPGRVAAVYVNDGEAVEFGQALFAIEE